MAMGIGRGIAAALALAGMTPQQPATATTYRHKPIKGVPRPARTYRAARRNAQRGKGPSGYLGAKSQRGT